MFSTQPPSLREIATGLTTTDRQLGVQFPPHPTGFHPLLNSIKPNIPLGFLRAGHCWDLVHELIHFSSQQAGEEVTWGRQWVPRFSPRSLLALF